MKRSIVLVGLCLASSLAIVGCGGSAGPGGSFAGTYVGVYQIDSTNVGEVALNITSTGSITGLEINTSTQTSTEITSGSINSSGTLSLTSLNGTATGIATLTSGELNANLTSVSQNETITFVNLQSSSGRTVPYTGFYAGTFTYNGAAGSTATMIVNNTGQITAWIENAATSTVITTTGSINSGGGAELAADGAGGSVSGSLTFNSGGFLAGTLTGNTTPVLVFTLTPNQ